MHMIIAKVIFVIIMMKMINDKINKLIIITAVVIKQQREGRQLN